MNFLYTIKAGRHPCAGLTERSGRSRRFRLRCP
jgi:hypothetical protein